MSTTATKARPLQGLIMRLHTCLLETCLPARTNHHCQRSPPAHAPTHSCIAPLAGSTTLWGGPRCASGSLWRRWKLPWASTHSRRTSSTVRCSDFLDRFDCGARLGPFTPVPPFLLSGLRRCFLNPLSVFPHWVLQCMPLSHPALPLLTLLIFFRDRPPSCPRQPTAGIPPSQLPFIRNLQLLRSLYNRC